MYQITWTGLGWGNVRGSFHIYLDSKKGKGKGSSRANGEWSWDRIRWSYPYSRQFGILVPESLLISK